MKKQKVTEQISDLDYLAQAGFEQVTVSASEKEQVARAVRRRFSRNLPGGIALSVALLILLAAVPAYRVLTNDDAHANTQSESATAPPPVPDLVAPGDNLVTAHEEKNTRPMALDESSRPAIVKTTEPRNASEAFMPMAVIKGSLEVRGSSGERLKFAYNAPVRFISECKVTEYERLYFVPRRSVHPGGTAASLSGEATHARQLPERHEYLHETLAEALACFHNGAYRESLYLLHLISSYNRDDLNCTFYTSMCHFMLERYRPAISGFQNCLSSPNNTFHQEARYYKALAHAACGENASARALMEQVASENDFYSERAKEWLSGN
jgi:hypothetical protein